MQTESTGLITQLLRRIASGEDAAANELVETVYVDLHRMAKRQMASERAGHLLQPSALINEAFIQLQNGGVFEKGRDRRYFFAAAAEAMRRILVDHAKSERAKKRGGDWTKTQIDVDLPGDSGISNVDMIALNDAIENLANLSRDQAQAIDLRLFAGLSVKEVATELECSVSKVEKDLRSARAFLYSQLAADDDGR